MSRLDEAFAAVGAVHRSEQFDAESGSDFQYLSLVCLGQNGWAATFDFVFGGDEWFEPRHIAEHPTAARGATPEDAILAAVEKFHALDVKEQG